MLTVNETIEKLLAKLTLKPSETSVDDLGLRRFGYTVVGVLFVLVVLWAGLAPIESAALGPGVVQVEGKRKSIQHLEGGVVSDILVANGDAVDAGQPLVLLDAARDRAELKILAGRLFNTQALNDRLMAERDGRKTVAYEPALVAAAQEDIRAENAIANEQALFEARLADWQGEAAVVEQRVHQYEQQKRGFESIVTARRQVAESLLAEVTDLSELLEEGYVDKQRIRELERSAAQVIGEISDTETKIAATEVAITETQLQIVQLQKRFKTQVVAELNEAAEILYDQQQQYTAVEDRVVRATIRSPVSGVVMGLRPNTIGAVIRPGEVLMDVVPNAEKLMVEARISPMDIDRVRVGQPAEVRFSVFKDAYLISGELTKLSADRMVDEASDMAYFAAEIRLAEEDIYLLQGMDLVPGMPAEVLVKTGERSMLGYLTSPMNRLFSRALIED